MANYCSFDIRIKGRKGNVLLLANSIRTLDGGNFVYSHGTDEIYEVLVHGSCKWSVNFAVTDVWDGYDIDIDLNTLSEEMIMDISDNYCGYSLRAKSRVLRCEVQAHYWSAESEFDHFDHFIDGRRIKNRKIEYSPSNVFDWDTLEFKGHEGEIDETQSGEMNSLLFANRFSQDYDAYDVLSVLEDHDDDDIVEDETDTPDLADLINIREMLEAMLEDTSDDDYLEEDGDTDDKNDEYAILAYDEEDRIVTEHWDISRPVGFCETESITLKEANSDSIVLVPADYVDVDSFNDIPLIVRIDISPVEHEVFGNCDGSYLDTPAKQGLVRLAAVTCAEDQHESTGLPFQIVTIAHDVAGVFITHVHSKDDAILNCVLLTPTQTWNITVARKASGLEFEPFLKSVAKWLSTCYFNDTEWVPCNPLIEDPECLTETLQGNTDVFDNAIDQLVDQYKYAAAGSISFLNYCQEYLHDSRINVIRNAKMLLSDAFRTKALCVAKADAFIAKLKDLDVSDEIMKHIYEKLQDFEEAVEEYELEDEDDDDSLISIHALHDNNTVVVHEPLSIKARIAAWATDAARLDPGTVSSTNIDIWREEMRAVYEQQRAQRMAQWMQQYGNAFTVNPTITVMGKKFVFSGLGGMYENEKEHPIVQDVLEQGGLFREKISGVTDYLVIGEHDPGESKVKNALEQQNAGNPLQIIKLKDLEAVLYEQPAIGNDVMSTETLPTDNMNDDTESPIDATAHYGYTAQQEAPVFTIENGVLKHTEIPAGCVDIFIPEGVVELGPHCLLPANTTLEDLEDEQWDIYHNIASIQFPQSLKIISAYALCDLETNVSTLTLPRSLAEIGVHGCSGFDSLENLTILNPATKVHFGAFIDISMDVVLHVPQGLSYIADSYYISKDPIITSSSFAPIMQTPEFHVQNGVLVGVYLPENCQHVIIPETVETIAADVFYCANVTSIVLPNSLTLIEKHAFRYCKLESITIPPNVKKIEGWAFAESGLRDLTILNGNENIEIETAAFFTYTLETVTIQNPRALVYDGAFDFSDANCTLHIPHKLAYLANFYPTAVIHYIDNEPFANEPEFVVHGTSLIGAYIPEGSKHITVPNGITDIEIGALANTPPETIDLPNTLSRIRSRVFSGCKNLRSIIIPEGVKLFNGDALSNCEKLMYIQLPSTLKMCVCKITDSSNLQAIVGLNDRVIRLLELMTDITNITWYLPAHLQEKVEAKFGADVTVRYLSEDDCEKLRNGATIQEIDASFVLRAYDDTPQNDMPMAEVEHKPQMDFEQEDATPPAEEPRQQAELDAEKARMLAEAERLRAQQEREEAERRAAEQQKQAKRDQINAERDALQRELNSLKGLFAAFKRKKLQERIDELDRQLRRL